VNAYKDILEKNYFLNVLKYALNNFHHLRSSTNAFSTYGKNMDGKMNGLKIMEEYNSGKRFCVGRSQGFSGNAFQTDISAGGWKMFEYEVKFTELPLNRNWFTSSQFVDAVNKENSGKSEPETE